MRPAGPRTTPMATDPPVAPAADPADARLSVHDGDLPAQAVEVVDAALGDELLLELRGYGPGLAKYTMRRWLGSAPAGA